MKACTSLREFGKLESPENRQASCNAAMSTCSQSRCWTAEGPFHMSTKDLSPRLLESGTAPRRAESESVTSCWERCEPAEIAGRAVARFVQAEMGTQSSKARHTESLGRTPGPGINTSQVLAGRVPSRSPWWRGRHGGLQHRHVEPWHRNITAACCRARPHARRDRKVHLQVTCSNSAVRERQRSVSFAGEGGLEPLTASKQASKHACPWFHSLLEVPRARVALWLAVEP